MEFRLINLGITQITCLSLLLGLSACGGGSGDGTGGRGNPGALPGSLTLGLTDAAVNNAQEVWVQFSGVTLKPVNGEAFDPPFNGVKNINLLSLQGTASTELISESSIPNGQYEWIRLHVNATNDGNTNDSYIKLDDGSIHELWIPSGSESGLKINTGFDISAMEKLNLMIDFDLRKSVVESNGDYKLRPALRMVETKISGTVSGTINATEVTAANCSDTDPATGNAVYLFEGFDATPDDLRNGNAGPFTSANVELNVASGNYEYVIGFVPEGNYTLAFTCQADLDDPDSNDNIAFNSTENISVEAGQTPPPEPAPGPIR